MTALNVSYRTVAAAEHRVWSARNRSLLPALIAVAMLFGVSIPATAQPVTLHVIESLSTSPPPLGPGAIRTQSIPYGITRDGGLVVGYAEANDAINAYRWAVDVGTESLGAIPTSEKEELSVAAGVSWDGSVIVGHSVSDDGRVAVRWMPDGSIMQLGDLPNARPLRDRTDSQAEDVSADGAVVVGRGTSSDGGDRAFVWTESTGMIELPGTISANAVSADGTVVVGRRNHPQGGTDAFVWGPDAGTEGLGFLPGGSFSRAEGVSGDGLVVVGRADVEDGEYEAFRWTREDGMVPLGDFANGAHRSEATAASASGAVIVGFGTADNDDMVPFVWTPEKGMQSLLSILVDEFGVTELTNWREFGWAFAVSADGRTIAGRGRPTPNEYVAWVVTLPASYINDPAADGLTKSSNLAAFDGISSGGDEGADGGDDGDGGNMPATGICGAGALPLMLQLTVVGGLLRRARRQRRNLAPSR